MHRMYSFLKQTIICIVVNQFMSVHLQVWKHEFICALSNILWNPLFSAFWWWRFIASFIPPSIRCKDAIYIYISLVGPRTASWAASNLLNSNLANDFCCKTSFKWHYNQRRKFIQQTHLVNRSRGAARLKDIFRDCVNQTVACSNRPKRWCRFCKFVFLFFTRPVVVSHSSDRVVVGCVVLFWD